jgi:hypothetical protein
MYPLSWALRPMMLPLGLSLKAIGPRNDYPFRKNGTADLKIVCKRYWTFKVQLWFNFYTGFTISQKGGQASEKSDDLSTV